MFGIQDGGMCVTSPTAHKTYNKYGESQDCKSDGKGGRLANEVYRFPGRKGKFIFCDNKSGSYNYSEAEGSTPLTWQGHFPIHRKEKDGDWYIYL